jgi:predicted enzyme related to lactoylglutathione lyase
MRGKEPSVKLKQVAGSSVIGWSGNVNMESGMANPFVHVELGTTDIDKAKSFYRSLFNWQLNDVEMGGGMTYTLIGVGEGTGGGMMKHPVPGAPSAWLPYVQVDDLVAATAKAKSLGATVMRDVTPVMDEGAFSIIVDPTGAALGLWQQKTK